MRKSISLNLSKKLLQNVDKIANVNSIIGDEMIAQADADHDLKPDAEEIAREALLKSQRSVADQVRAAVESQQPDDLSMHAGHKLN